MVRVNPLPLECSQPTSCSLSMLGELTDIGREVGQYSLGLCPRNLILIRLTVNLRVWSCFA